MPVNTPHKSYSAASHKWKKIRTVIQGQDAVKASAETYVPKPRGFKDKDPLWKEYIQRGEFYNATARTVTGLLGSMFRRDPVVELPAAFESWKKIATKDGLSVEGLCKLISKEQIEVGRFGLLVDMPSRPEGEQTPKNARPYIAGYCAEKIINWAYDITENPDNPGELLVLPSLIVLWEAVEEKNPKDEFSTVEIEQYRVLQIVNGVYTVKVYRQKAGSKKTEFLVHETAEPKGPNGKPLTFIPFIFISPENLLPEIERSPIEDLAEMNLSHFVTACDLEWACHLTACPQAVVTGWKKPGNELAMGSAVAWTFEDAEVKAYLLEYHGQGIEALEKRQEKKEDKMAKLGANLLRSKSKQPETAETTKIEHSAESSILSMIARNSSAAVSKALSWAIWWSAGTTEEVTVEQNTEFYDSRLTSEELDKLMAGVQSGALSVSVYCYNLIRGDMTKRGVTQEELEKEIEKSLEDKKPAPLPGLGALPPSPKAPPTPLKKKPGAPGVPGEDDKNGDNPPAPPKDA